MKIVGTYDSGLVALSIFIAIAASYTALDLASRVRASSGLPRFAWLATAALAMGGGIWAMHFVAMLAFTIPSMPVAYDIGLTILSLLIAIVVTGLSFLVISRARPTPALLLASGLFMGLGIAAMHYTGMAAMEMTATVQYEPAWVAVSVLIAVSAATVALWLSTRTSRLVVNIASALVMGMAVSGMHYGAMQGAVFALQPGAAMASAGLGWTRDSLAVGVAVSTFLILSLALTAAMFDRRFALLAEREGTALRQSEERFRLLYTRTPLPLHSLDQNGHVEHVTEAWITLMGYPRDQVIGRPLTSFMTETSRRQAVQSDWPALLAQGELNDVEYSVLTRAGEVLEVLASTRVERDDHGDFLRVLGGLTNVTERKRAEEALRQAQKMEAVGQLTGGVAHDFNNLLSVVLGNLELLRKRLPDDSRAAGYLDNALQAVQRGTALTQRMLVFARKQELNPEPVYLPDLVRGMAELLQRSLGPTIRVDTQFPLYLPQARVDANQLELVLLNLAVNARDAMSDGGRLCISATVHAVSAMTDGLQAGEYVCLSVADSGVGMDPMTLARATEPFFTTKGVGKGTGLGLSMAHGLAAQSGGRLLLHSEPGRGTTAELWLPAVHGSQAQPHAADAPAQSVQPLPPSAPLRILVVDDDALVLENTVAMLEDLGHTVLRASSGENALAVLRCGAALDLVLTDQAMPEMTGLELAGVLRSERPNLSVLLVSGCADQQPNADVNLAKLSKPFGLAALAKAIAEVTRKREASVIPLRARKGHS